MSSSSDSLLATSRSSSDEEFIIIRKPKKYIKRQYSLKKWTDEEFYCRFRLSKAVVNELVKLLRGILQSRSNRGGAISTETKILLTLRFYATGNMLRSVADFVGVSIASASRIVFQVSEAIASLRPQFIKMPTTARELNEVALDFYQIARFPMCCGAIDCTHIKIISPVGEDAEIFRNRKGYFSLNVQTVSDPHLKICNIVARWPGSCHDQTIFNNSLLKQKFENGVFSNYKLIGDSGYALQSYLLTPLMQVHTEPENLFNESLIRTRNVVERKYGVWKRRFPILSNGIKLNVNTAMTVIVATAVLHIAIEMNEEISFELDDTTNTEQDNPNGSIEEDNTNARNLRNIFINNNFIL